MTHIRSRLLLAATVVSVSLASETLAQGGQPPRPRDAQRGQQGAVEMSRRGGGQAVGPNRNNGAGRGSAAGMLLRMRSELQLTDDQVKRLEALQSAAAPKSNEADVLRARADLLEATQGDGNLTKARAALDRMSGLRNERMIAGLKQRQDARAVLTAEQKTKLDNFRTQRRGRGGMIGGNRAGMRGGARGARGPQGRNFWRGGMGPGRGQSQGMGPGMRGGMRGFRGGVAPGAPVPPDTRPAEGELPPA